ncbi:MAG: DUF1275 domain-containing protein [Deltaproteobacteria bacterium]|nr:DUF1275 domain-containing protein [Deltaproteobacteria bacterium]
MQLVPNKILLNRQSMLLILTLAAGGMDSISYLGLGEVFTAMMTGNTVLFGLSVGQGEYLAALRGVVALAGFALGVAAGTVIVDCRPKNKDWPVTVTWALVLEVVLLVFFVLLWHLSGGERSGGLRYGMITVSAMAMGIQSAAARCLGVPGITTTYITGTLTTLMATVVHLRLWKKPFGKVHIGEPKEVLPGGFERYSTSHMMSLFSVIFCYGLGAFIGSVMIGNGSLIFESGFPALAVFIVVINAALGHWFCA